MANKMAETQVDSYTFLLNKIQKELSELELVQDIGNDTNLLEKIKKIKDDLKNISFNKDIKKLEKIWNDYFVVTKPQQNTIEDDFM
jgi:hypothetical protein